MSNNTVLYVGAEAEIRTSHYMGLPAVQKKRLPKGYRIQEIDRSLIASRTREESKLIMESRHHGVAVPLIYDVDLEQGIITMEYLRGKRIKDIFNTLSSAERKTICEKIGKSIAKLHNNNIIHGDITTSNMILLDDHIHFIDFGLGTISDEIEAKGVDLHVLMEAFESTHSRYAQSFDSVLEGYKQVNKKDSEQVHKKIDEIIKRGRYR